MKLYPKHMYINKEVFIYPLFCAFQAFLWSMFCDPMNMPLIYVTMNDVKNTNVRLLSNCGPERNCKATGAVVFLTEF